MEGLPMIVLGVIVLAAIRGLIHGWRMRMRRQPPQVALDAPRPTETIDAYYRRMDALSEQMDALCEKEGHGDH